MQSILSFLRKIAEVLSDEPTQDMIDFFNNRTKIHINYVNENLKKIAKKLPEFDLPYNHDASKFSKEELVPYIWLTDYYRKNKNLEYPKGMEDKINKAVEHHYKSNSHHPEFYGSPSEMPKKAIVEMVSDWGAMSKEKGGSVRKWASEHTNGFTKKQKDLINELIDIIE